MPGDTALSRFAEPPKFSDDFVEAGRDASQYDYVYVFDAGEVVDRSALRVGFAAERLGYE